MPFTSREAIFNALFKLLGDVALPDYLGAWIVKSRDFQTPEQMAANPANQPTLSMIQTPQHAVMDTFGLSQWKLGATAVIYYRTEGIPDSDMARDKIVNDVIDSFDRAINPMPGMAQTLGGMVLHTYIEGAVIFDNGLTDQQAFVLIPITILIGAFGS
jgi:hypothetical protein